MDVPTLILLGAAGGLLRGVLDVYTRFVTWQADRRAHRQWTAAGVAQGQAPRFQVYFDPAVDAAAAVVHSLMGAGAAVLFGMTDQINGEYAALVVGMSAPMLLTQLGRIQTVNEAVTGERQPATPADVATAPAAPEAGGPSAAAAVGPADGSGAASPAATATAASRAAPGVAVPPTAVPSSPEPAPARTPTPPPVSAPSLRPPAPVTDTRAPGAEPAPGREPAPDEFPSGGAEYPDPTRRPGSGSGFDGRGAPRWRQRPATGEEGL